MHSKLYLYHFDSRPDISELNVKKKQVKHINGCKFIFRIIGSSHYIECEKLGVYELLSCKATDKESTAVVELLADTEEVEVSDVESKNITLTTELIGEPLSEFDSSDTYDMKYKFGENAYTTITYGVRGGNIWYETYHTYPEFDLAFYSQTTIAGTAQ